MKMKKVKKAEKSRKSGKSRNNIYKTKNLNLLLRLVGQTSLKRDKNKKRKKKKIRKKKKHYTKTTWCYLAHLQSSVPTVTLKEHFFTLKQ
jgi:hypothetical protein